MTPFEDGVASISYLSDDEVDQKVDLTYLYLRALRNETNGTSAYNRTAPNARIDKTRFRSDFSRHLLH